MYIIYIICMYIHIYTHLCILHRRCLLLQRCTCMSSAAWHKPSSNTLTPPKYMYMCIYVHIWLLMHIYVNLDWRCVWIVYTPIRAPQSLLCWGAPGRLGLVNQKRVLEWKLLLLQPRWMHHSNQAGLLCTIQSGLDFCATCWDQFSDFSSRNRASEKRRSFSRCQSFFLSGKKQKTCPNKLCRSLSQDRMVHPVRLQHEYCGVMFIQAPFFTPNISLIWNCQRSSLCHGCYSFVQTALQYITHVRTHTCICLCAMCKFTELRCKTNLSLRYTGIVRHREV